MKNKIDYNKINNWLSKHDIMLEESFVSALRSYAKQFKKEKEIKRIDDVYQMIGTRKAYISYWERHLCSSQTKNF